MKQILGALTVLALLAGCASTSVTTKHSRAVDFSAFETFQYKDSDANAADANPAAHRRTIEAIKRQLSASGLSETDSRPDLFVTYYASGSEEAPVDPSGSSFGYVADFSTSIKSTELGTIVVDLWDAASNQLVWRGEAMRVLSRNPDTNLARIDEGIAKMFQTFPPGS